MKSFHYEMLNLVAVMMVNGVCVGQMSLEFKKCLKLLNKTIKPNLKLFSKKIKLFKNSLHIPNPLN